ncbi:phospholipase A-2-activating protein [Chelonus insularis]|uniref:phospholipase A-2-activating protein n=1 Tax=Chelonus insularis TaxID=460826 RepID=UPI00158CC8B4|nr:phospholipase A-2-activating protein [Chelonus insularis]
MDKPVYKLSCTLLGHSEDVRAIATFQDGTIVSASRDKTARVWLPNRGSNGYAETAVLEGHSNFVSSVCVIHSTERYPKSLIITGSNDRHICVYLLGEKEPMIKMKAHEDTVCNLKAGNEEGTFLSCSWDLTGKLWHLDNIGEPRLILQGHTLAVWCIADLPNKLILTGSADKSVIVWTRDGLKLHTLEGHTDCVRNIATLKDDEFLTCANDATIRHWNATSGSCMGVYYGHENYIYSMAILSNGLSTVTSGEDKTIRVWKNGQIDQTITLPTSSVWCVDFLVNGDIVSGSSDGIIRIFSNDSSRWASAEELEAWEHQVNDDQLKSQQELAENININTMPTISELSQPGTHEGQIKMINENGKPIVYSWSQNEKKWNKVGDVVGATGKKSSKQLYNGKEYDYIFHIDVQEGAPPLKLPYNKTEDPWHVAQKFIHQHGLSQMFLDQIANFIIKNSESTPVFNTNSQLTDPFTGGNRYIPGSSSSSNISQAQANISNADPFTGANRYIPQNNITNPQSSTTSYIPHNTYLKFEQANLTAILEKLKEFNSKQNAEQQIPEDELVAVVDAAKNKFNPEVINTLWKLLDWSDEYVFPALDITRLVVLNKTINDQLCNDNLVPIIQRHLKKDALLANQMLTFRLLSNMFNHEKGERLDLMNADNVLKYLSDLSSLGNKNNQIAIATYILNLVIAFYKTDNVPGRTKVCNVIIKIFAGLKDPEAVFRILVALGTLLTIARNNIEENKALIQIIQQSNETVELLKSMSISKSMLDPHGRVSKCSTHILNLIS